MIFDNILIYFVIVPLLTLLGLALCQNKGIKAIRTVAATGATVLVAMAVYLVVYFLQERGAGNDAQMLLTDSWCWYAPLNINLALGVDGVSVVMILLSAFIVFAGVFASWEINRCLASSSCGSSSSLLVCLVSSSLLTSSPCLCSTRWLLFLCTSLSVYGVRATRTTLQ